jgi:hypothetical protein
MSRLKAAIALISSGRTRAIYQHKQVSANYGSLESGEAERILSPVTLAHDGLRWHIRCRDHAKEKFKDYNLARFIAVKECGPSEVTLEQDEEWAKEVTITLAPHPKAAHPETIRLDYDIAGESKNVVMRLCLAPYFLRHWHVDTTPNATKNPNEQQLFLSNRQELLERGVSAWVFDEDVFSHQTTF